MKTNSALFAMGVCILLSGCLGSSENDPAPDNTDVETPAAESSSAESPSAETPYSETPEIKIDIPIIASPLVNLAITATRSNNEIDVSWTDANAESYRVLFWHSNGRLNEWRTEKTTQIIPSNLSLNAGQIIVEAYDILGNSIFSSPTSMEAK